jgi:D-3-phosphoglycerate dehydrogenase
MSNWSHLADAHVVRLNATMHANRFEEAYYQRYGLNPVFCEPYTPDEIIEYVKDCDALLVVSASLPTKVIESLRRCKVISRLGTGTDKIDVATATRRGILVTNVPDFCVEEQAEHTMALLLALERKLPQMHAAMTEGAWSRSKLNGWSCRRLSSLTLGLVGFGNSAKATARRAKASGMRVLATRRNLEAARQDAAELGVELTDLETILRESDYVSLHLPLAADSYHLLDETALRKMKPGARLINTSRGAIVDELALARLLREGVIDGAGLDTFEHIDVFTTDERPIDHPLLGLDNVILTPHVAALSVQAAQDVARGGVENVATVLSGHWPRPDRIVNRGVQPWFPLAEYDPALLSSAGADD